METGRASDPVLRLRGVRVVRDGASVLDGVDWEVRPGERWAVLGPNGSGKTTMLRVAGMRLLPTQGTVEALGETYGRTDARALRRRIAFVSGSLLRGLRP
ncbi:MAG: ATP-binding cassette domain-containing protein, partial [Acidimicrobiales bacterium]